MIYSLTLPTQRSDRLDDSVEDFIRNSEGRAQQKELQKTSISGLPSYDEVISTYKPSPTICSTTDKPPPYSID